MLSLSDSSENERTGRDPSEEVTDPEETRDCLVPYFACQRESRRPCVNQALVDELAPIREWRFLQYGSQSAGLELETAQVGEKNSLFSHGSRQQGVHFVRDRSQRHYRGAVQNRDRCAGTRAPKGAQIEAPTQMAKPRD